MKKLIKQMKKDYDDLYKNCYFPKIATIAQSNEREKRYVYINGEYCITNQDFEITILADKKDPKDVMKEVVKRVVEFQDELVFSLLDQSYSPIGTYGYWKYEEKFNDDMFCFEPSVKINRSGKLIGIDKMPLFSPHIDEIYENIRKTSNNIFFERLTFENYKKARKLLTEWNRKELETDHTFLLIVCPDLEQEAKELKKTEEFNLLTCSYLKNLKWALMLETKESKPLIFQLRQKPEFEIVDNKETSLLSSEKEILICANMRCNVGIHDWKKIVGYFEKKEESFSTLRIWDDCRKIIELIKI